MGPPVQVASEMPLKSSELQSTDASCQAGWTAEDGEILSWVS